MTDLRISDLVRHIGGTLILAGDDFKVDGIAPLDRAGPRDISFLTHPKYKPALARTRAGAVLMKDPEPGVPFSVILSEDPYLALARLLTLLHSRIEPPEGIHPSAVIRPDARLGTGVRIDAGVVVGSRSAIGDRTVLCAGVVVGDETEIGRDCMIYPNVTLYHSVRIGSGVIIHAGAVIGSDGFGYAREGCRYVKIPQIGRVYIEDDVEIGACCTIDRGSLNDTRICRGAKLDNLIHIAHNVTIGEDTAMAAQTGISGSTAVGKRVVMAGQVGVAGHITISDDSILTGKCGVTKSIPPKTMLSGFPPMNHRSWLRTQAVLSRAVELKGELDRLTRRIEELERRLVEGKEIKGD
ncbi:UDP-3-O-(3-hydroxymyristoyl)glucosamine N-acyltransferase [bacterium]|nr:UDP-3-O-(3-hydroxymyristoyl)glucosamine N-acyltransferase [candidate division CSSED10-310 bacterium]